MRESGRTRDSPSLPQTSLRNGQARTGLRVSLQPYGALWRAAFAWLASCRPAAVLGSCYSTGMSVSFPIELDREDDGRWIAEIRELPGALCYGSSRDEAIARVQALALRVLADRLEHAEAPAELLNVSFRAA